MNKLDLQHIFNDIIAPQHHGKKDHFLFLLGTDTQYTAKPTINNALLSEQQRQAYEDGEPLSYTANLLASHLKEESSLPNAADAQSPHAFASFSIDLINGPSTFGAEVGNRIAHGVYLGLKAAAQGKENLLIMGHSRGAAESYLVVHELERITEALRQFPKKKLHDILLETECSLTRKAFEDKNLFANINSGSEENRAELLNRLEALKIHCFLIDPVPGDPYYFVKTVSWHDDRFYKSTKSQGHQLLIYRDERTRCFVPIIPPGLEASALVVPAHHGSAGNNYGQDGRKIIPKKAASGLHGLVITKLWHFIHQKTGLFSFKEQEPANELPEPVSLEHPFLDQMANEFIQEKEKDDVLFRRYEAIVKYDEEFKKYARSGYPYLGTFHAPIDKSRWVHYRNQNYEPLGMVLGTGSSGVFVNQENAKLFLKTIIKDPEEIENASPAAALTILSSILENTVNNLLRPCDELDIKAKKLIAYLRDDKENGGFNQVKSALNVFVESVSQKYINNHLTKKEKHELRKAIKLPFEKLNAEVEGLKPEDKTIISNLNQYLKTNLEKTLHQHYSNVKAENELLNEQIQVYLKPHKKQAILRAFLDKIEQKEEETFSPLQEALHKIKEEDWTIESFQIVVREFLNQIETPEVPFADEKAHALQERKDKIVQAVLDEVDALKINELQEILQNSPAQNLFLLEKQYQTTSDLITGLKDLEQLTSNSNIDIHQLKYHKKTLIELASKLILENKLMITDALEQTDKAFFYRAQQMAVARYETREYENRKKPEQIIAQQKIDYELLPRCQRHLDNLRNQALHFFPNAQLNPNAQRLPAAPDDLPAFQQERFSHIVTEFNYAQNIYKALKFPFQLPTEKITAFNALIGQHNAQALAITNVFSIDERAQKFLQNPSDVQTKKAQQKELNAQKEINNLLLPSTLSLLSYYHKKAQEYDPAIASNPPHQALQCRHFQFETNEQKNAFLELRKRHFKALTLYRHLTSSYKFAADKMTAANRIINSMEQDAKTLYNEYHVLHQEAFQRSKNHVETHETRQQANQKAIEEIIDSKLLPLTIQHMDYLKQQAARFDPKARSQQLDKPLANAPVHLSNKDKIHFNKIKAQFDATVELYQTLKSPYLVPEEKVTTFTSILKNHEANLKWHTDSKWKRYTKNCFIALAILATGILPGLITLGVHAYRNNRSMTFFAQSRGHHYHQDCEQQIKSLSS